MRMVEPGGYSHFTEEPVRDQGGEFGAENLERDGAVVLQVLGVVDRGHSPLADLPLDRVAISKGRARVRGGVPPLAAGHSRAGWRSPRELEARNLGEPPAPLMPGWGGLAPLP